MGTDSLSAGSRDVSGPPWEHRGTHEQTPTDSVCPRNTEVSSSLCVSGEAEPPFPSHKPRATDLHHPASWVRFPGVFTGGETLTKENKVPRVQLPFLEILKVLGGSKKYCQVPKTEDDTNNYHVVSSVLQTGTQCLGLSRGAGQPMLRAAASHWQGEGATLHCKTSLELPQIQNVSRNHRQKSHYDIQIHVFRLNAF